MRALVAAVCCGLVAVGCGSPSAPTVVLVTGTIHVQAVNTFVPIIATVEASTSEGVQRVQTAADGIARVQVPLGQPVTLTITATGYTVAHTQLVPTGDFSTTVNLGF